MRIFDCNGSVDKDGLVTFSINGVNVLEDSSGADAEYVLSKLKKVVRISKDILEKKEVKK